MRDFFSHADICKQSEKQIVRKKEYRLAWHDTQHEKSMTLIRQENNDLSTNLK